MLIKYILHARFSKPKKYFFLLLLSINLSDCLIAQSDTTIVRKEYNIVTASKSPRIDGVLDDEVWLDVPVITDFRQAFPDFNKPTTQKTEVKMVYDNTAIYISAVLYDSHPDSIAHQLGNRDDDVHADKFRIVFDTYNKEQDAFEFIITASGVQMDSRISDYLYNAVWESAVKINDKGWSVEMKIPYSALRFPNAEKQIWGLQITREIARNAEFDQWALTPKDVANVFKYWGVLTGLQNLKEPIRLSLTPYLTAYTSHYPANIPGESNYNSNITGGLDLKYGINESFTVDATLLPDFSQVQSDNVVKNLSAFEQYYDEQRPFFNEGTDLFQKGDLFYSRRIGRRPSNYYAAYSDPNKTVIKNPEQSKLLNATKLSGRTPSGLGIGILNAVLDNTYATLRDTSGNENKFLTEPFSNYNIVVFDQQMKNSSNVYLINTNVNRQHGYNNANTTGAGFSLQNKKNTFEVYGSGAFTNVFSKADTNKNTITDNYGYKYDAGFAKNSGKFQFAFDSRGINPTYNNNDIGITQETNFMNNTIELNYQQSTPFGKFLSANLHANFNQQLNFTTKTQNGMNANIFSFWQLKSYHNFHLGFESDVTEHRDYYEARSEGRIFMRPKSLMCFSGYNSDSRKKLMVNINFHYGSTAIVTPTIGRNIFYGISASPYWRVNDKFALNVGARYSLDDGDRGWVGEDEYGTIIFGVRKLIDITSNIGAKYLFRNNLSLSFNVRHYWTSGHYKSFYDLTDSGFLIDNISYETNHDFNFNAFNVDMLFQWQFAPGSSLNLSWKNSIFEEGDKINNDYSSNLKNTLDANQLNTVSLKALYYFDYLYLKKKRKKN